jgi:hypothetical protein
VRRHGPPKGPYSCTLEYIAARPNKGKAWPLVVAAIGICRSQGCCDLYSAADLSQTGQAYDNQAKSARGVHYTWGFTKVTPEEWRGRGLTRYHTGCKLLRMKKPVGPL